MKRLATLAAVIFAASGLLYAADTMSGSRSERIRTLRMAPLGSPLGLPVTTLADPVPLVLSFDHLASDREFFRYRLVHCDANWRPDGLVDSEFLDGFNEGTIDDYEYSQATMVPYVHYRLAIPNADVAPTISGNYLLQVYNENEPDSIVAQQRFMITEQTAPVRFDVSPQTDVDYRNAHQQLEIYVDTERAGVDDVFNDMLVVVGQNGRLDTETSVRRPLRFIGTEAVFAHAPQLIFEAGNEYRRFETVTDRYPGMGVDDIEYFEPYYHYVLAIDYPRDDSRYQFDRTQNGGYVVRRSGANDSDTEADYGVVHFSLEMPEIPGAMVFIDGDLTDRRFDANARMTYNHTNGRYERAMLLKQGSYNYQYVVVPPGGRRAYTAPIEGDKWETDNFYTVRVYNRRRGERYDRLIGFGAANINQ